MGQPTRIVGPRPADQSLTHSTGGAPENPKKAVERRGPDAVPRDRSQINADAVNARWGNQLTAASRAAAVEWSAQQYEAALARQYEESSDEEDEEP